MVDLDGGDFEDFDDHRSSGACAAAGDIGLEPEPTAASPESSELAGPGIVEVTSAHADGPHIDPASSALFDLDGGDFEHIDVRHSSVASAADGDIGPEPEPTAASPEITPAIGGYGPEPEPVAVFPLPASKIVIEL